MTVEDILPLARPPKVEITSLNDKEKGYFVFTAATQTTTKIENYSWVIRDLKTLEIVDSDTLCKENTFGKALKSGDYKISCEVVDEDGLIGGDEVETEVG